MNYQEKLPQEDEHIEYKEGLKNFPKEAWKTISAFENTDGGTLILGVKEYDKLRHKFQIVGVENPQQILDEFWSQNTNPQKINHSTITNNDITINEVNGAEIIEIKIHQASDQRKPIYLNNDINQSFIRNGSTDTKADKDSMKTLIRLSEDQLDTQVLRNYNLDDLDLKAVEDYKNELTARENYQMYKELDTVSFLKRIGVISKDYRDSGKEGITVGGLLFFGENNAILHTFPNFQLDYFDKSHPDQERWTTRISSIESNLNIYTFFKRVDTHLYNSYPNAFKLDEKGKRIDSFGSMVMALREGLINMLMHADYFGDSPIVLNNLTNYYQFDNPGKMKIPSEDFFTTNNSKNRNAIISKLFLQAGYGERAGHGGEKIYESSVVNNYRAPEIKTDINSTHLTIWKVDYASSFSGKEVTPRERQIIKAIISSTSWTLTHKEIENITGFSRFKVDTAINSLIDKKIIEKLGVGRSTRYSIQTTNEQLLAQAQLMPEILRKALQRNDK